MTEDRPNPHVWSRLVLSRHGTLPDGSERWCPEPNAATVYTVLLYDGRWTVTGTDVVPPGMSPRAWSSIENTRLAVWLSKVYDVSPSERVLDAAVALIQNDQREHDSGAWVLANQWAQHGDLDDKGRYWIAPEALSAAFGHHVRVHAKALKEAGFLICDHDRTTKNRLRGSNQKRYYVVDAATLQRFAPVVVAQAP